MCRLTLSLNNDVGQGVLIWGLYGFDDTLARTPIVHRAEKRTPCVASVEIQSPAHRL